MPTLNSRRSIRSRSPTPSSSTAASVGAASASSRGPATSPSSWGRCSCELAPFCVSERDDASGEEVKFATFSAGSTYAGAEGIGKVRDIGATAVYERVGGIASAADREELLLVCFSLQRLFDHFALAHVDYVSLDVEVRREGAGENFIGYTCRIA